MLKLLKNFAHDAGAFAKLPADSAGQPVSLCRAEA
jgi:hypothetical protein